MRLKGKLSGSFCGTAAAVMMISTLGFAGSLAGTASASPREAENKLVLIAKQDPGTFDYVSSILTSMLLWVPTNIVEPLVYFDAAGQAQPGVAESWIISDDRLSYEFKIRKTNFSDGTPVRAEDVIYSLNAMKTSPVSTYAGTFAAVTAIEKVDDATVRVTLSRPSQSFWRGMGGVTGLIQPEHGAETRATNPIGTGPYVLKSYTSNSSIELVANPDYWGGKPEIDAVTVRIISDVTTILNALDAGEADGMPAATSELLEQLGMRGLQEKFALAPYSQIGEPTYLVLNQKLDPELRQAMAKTVDREAYKAAFGDDAGVEATCTFAMPNRLWYEAESAESCPYGLDFEAAMAVAPQFADQKLEFAVLNSMSWLADLAIPSLQGAGFDITRNTMDLARYSQTIFQGRPPQFDITVMQGPDDPAQWSCDDAEKAGWSTYCSQPYSEALVAADSALDDAEYLAKMKEATEILRDDAVIVPILDQQGFALLDLGLKGFTAPRVHVAVEISKLGW